MMNKAEAVIEIIREARKERATNTSVKRVVKVLKTLGLDDKELIHVLGYLDYCNEDGMPYNKDIKRIW